MSLETDNWIALSPEQATFWKAQTGGAEQLAFSPTALEASIVPLYAKRFNFSVSSQSGTSYRAVVWPDLYALNGECMLIGNTTTDGLHTSAFLRMQQTPEAYLTEGVVLPLTQSWYGQQLMQRHDTKMLEIEGKLGGAELGMRFFASALANKAALGTGRRAYGAEVIGVEGDTVARLYRSLGSLGMNLTTNGVLPEQAPYTGLTYDFASVLFRTALLETSLQPPDKKGMGMYRAPGQPLTMIFESASRGIIVVRQLKTYPSTMTLAMAGRPEAGTSQCLIDQYVIQARGAAFDCVSIPAEAYHPHSIVSALATITPEARKDPGELAILSDESEQTLQRDILSLLTERGWAKSLLI